MHLLFADIILADIKSELHEYGRALKDISNPVYISIFAVISLSVLLYLVLKYWILPLQRKHAYEKHALELKNARLMALFADLDPDPIIRIDSKGRIIFLNPAAASEGYGKYIGAEIKDILPALEVRSEDYIDNNRSTVSYISHSGKHYAVQISGIKYLGIAQIYLHDITELKNNQQALELARNELQSFNKRLQEKIEEEKQHIARELHDGIGQSLVLAKLVHQKFVSLIPGAEGQPELGEINTILDNTIREVKGIAYSLKPRLLEEVGLLPAVSDLVEMIRKQSGIRGCIEAAGIKDRFSPELETAIFRIIQEALNNMVKYAQACEFFVRMSADKNRLKVIVSDDGRGFDPEAPASAKGLGLKNMKERTSAFNGTFRITSVPGDGTIIVAEFPVNQEQQNNE